MPQRFRPWLTDAALWTAWQKQLAEATATPWLWREVLQHGPDLFSRFAAHYQHLRALRRQLRRALQRQGKRSLAGVALLCALQPTPSWAANFTAATAKELIAAIKTANVTPGPDTITLTANITLTLPANTGGAGLPVIWTPITIVGNGHAIARSRKALPFGILTVNPTGNLTLQGTKISGGLNLGRGGGVFNDRGKVTLRNSTISDNSANQSGGGMFNNGGTMTLTNSTVSGNSAVQGGGVLTDRGKVTLRNSTISDNSANQSGGGMFNSGGTMTLTNSTVSGNSAAQLGGGVVDYGGTATFTDSTISGNAAARSGGGVFHIRGTVTLKNSTVSGNSAAQAGGGVVNYRGTMTLTNSTVSGNTAATAGGGIENVNSIRYGAVQASLTLSRSLISGNTAPARAEVSAYSTSGPIIPPTTDLTLFGHSGLTNAQAFASFTPGATDITATSDGSAPTALTAILDTALANNGGPTDTHNLVTGSPAIDAAPADANCPATDQRGAPRPFGPKCDLGAVEFGSTPPFAFTGFFRLTAPHGAFNVVQAGQGVPLTFSLDGDQGPNVLAEGSPTSRVIACNPTAPAVDVETPMTLRGGSRLSYDRTTDTYTYVWKTASRWANTCRQLIVKLCDGTKHRANFWFRK